MTDKNVFACKLFLLLNISDFNVFLCENCNPPKKGHPLFPSNPRLKAEVLSMVRDLTPPLPPPAERGGRGCQLCKHSLNSESKLGNLSYF